MNEWYERITNPRGGKPANQPVAPRFQNPIQEAMYIMQALTNPAAFVKQQFPDVPDGIINDPIQVRNYLQQSRGISDQQIQQFLTQYPRP